MQLSSALRVLPALALLVLGREARADRPTSPPRLVDACRQNPDSSLCREVRRLCATRAVRDDVVPACKELGWYGDTAYREITNLCPLDPTHVCCHEAKAACESHKAEHLGDDGERICREMGWGEYAYTAQPSAEAEVAPAAAPGPAPAAATTARAQPPDPPRPTWLAGLQGLGLRFALVDAAEAESHYTGHLDAAWLSFRRWPLAAEVVLDAGVASDGDPVYRADALLGVGRWWTSHIAAGLLAGAGVSGVAGDAALDLPLRLLVLTHAGDAASLAGWAQIDRYGFDSFELGGALVWGARLPANAGLAPRLWVGGLYQEQDGTRVFSVMVGVGAAKNPWNQ